MTTNAADTDLPLVLECERRIVNAWPAPATLLIADGLPPCVRLTPLVAPETRAAFVERGYAVRDASFGMVKEIAGEGFPDVPDPELLIEARPSAEWIAGVAERQTGPKANAAHLAAIVEKVRLPAAFATLSLEGEPVAFGMSVAERGMAEIGSVVVDAGRRGQGLGRRLMQGLTGWAAAQDCGLVYLQVDQKNAVANALYDRLGFRRLYAYETRTLE